MNLEDIYDMRGIKKEISIGDRLRNIESGEEYIVASPNANDAVLISLDNGMRWAFESVPAADVVLTKDEVIGLIGSDHFEFWEKIANAIDID